MSHEQTALDGAAARVTELMRPRARDDDAVTVASRSIDPAMVKSLTATPAAADGAELQCLAEAIYFESRGEPLEGQIAVAEVVLNRVDDRRFPNSVCAVTNQGVGRGRACQFSYACDGHPDVMKSAVARERSVKLAQKMLGGHPRTITSGATYFHSRAVKPGWSRKMTRTNAIGHHMFYRAGTRVAGG